MRKVKAVLLFALVFCGLGPVAQTQSTEISKAETTDIVHTVLLELKDDISEEDRNRFIAHLESLCTLDMIKECYVTLPFDTGDKRLVQGHDVLLYTTFENLEALNAYAESEFHLEVRDKLKPFLSAVPKVFDSVKNKQ